ncbi:MAG: phosphatase 2C-like domain-containing protein [Piptocephalis tieghemiana]|nr:MAG: phosphatase 2C-like domain-containing protein [Piptocephalis tieghemiana]
MRTFNLEHGASTDRGGKKENQDVFLLLPQLFEDEDDYSLYGVFDGHGSNGAQAATYIQSILPGLFRSRKDNFLSDPHATIRDIFQESNSLLCEDEEIDTYLSGTTASLVIITPNRLIIAHLGDSRIVLAQKHISGDIRAIEMTRDHTCYDPNELDRVLKAGARVQQMPQDSEGNTSRLDAPLRIFKGSLPYPGIVVSRALGDDSARRLGVSCIPDIREVPVTTDDLFLIIATDGVWDGLRSDQACTIIRAHAEDPQKASESLTKSSIQALDEAQIDDNTTNICIFLRHRRDFLGIRQQQFSLRRWGSWTSIT